MKMNSWLETLFTILLADTMQEAVQWLLVALLLENDLIVKLQLVVHVLLEVVVFYAVLRLGEFICRVRTILMRFIQLKVIKIVTTIVRENFCTRCQKFQIFFLRLLVMQLAIPMINGYLMLESLAYDCLGVPGLTKLLTGWRIKAQIYRDLGIPVFFRDGLFQGTLVDHFSFCLARIVRLYIFLRVRLPGTSLRILIGEILTLLIFHGLKITLYAILLGASLFEFTCQFSGHRAHDTLLSNPVVAGTPNISGEVGTLTSITMDTSNLASSIGDPLLDVGLRAKDISVNVLHVSLLLFE